MTYNSTLYLLKKTKVSGHSVVWFKHSRLVRILLLCHPMVGRVITRMIGEQTHPFPPYSNLVWLIVDPSQGSVTCVWHLYTLSICIHLITHGSLDTNAWQLVVNWANYCQSVLSSAESVPWRNVTVLDLLYLSRYVRILGNVVHAIQIKTKLCQLVEVMMERRDDLSFCQEMKFRSGKMTASPCIYICYFYVKHSCCAQQ